MSKDLEQYNHLQYGEKEVKVTDEFVDFLFTQSESTPSDLDANAAWDRFNDKIGKSTNKRTLWLKIAASVSLLAVLSVVLISLNSSPSVNTISSTKEKIEVQFPDGSLGVLNHSSSFTYPDKFGQERRVAFTGEAYFDIKKNEKPFIIDANGVEVKVLGTAFNLITNSTEVILYVDRGLVAFSKAGVETQVKAGLEAVFDKQTESVSIKEIPTENTMSWRNGLFKFVDTPLNQAIKDLSEYYQVDFELSNTKLHKCRISATIDQQTLGEVLVLLERILDVKVELKGNSVKISGKGC